MAFTDSPDSIYAVLTDLGRHSLARVALGEIGIKISGFSVGREGYQMANPVKIDPINTALTDLVDHVFPNVLGPQYTIQSLAGVSVTNTIFDASSILAIGTSVALTQSQIVSFSVDVFKTGSPVGGITVKLVKDLAGFPSTNPTDLIILRTFGAAGLSAGLNTLNVTAVNTTLDTGTYHLVVETDVTYNSGYVAGNDLSLIYEAAGTVPGVTWDGFVWSPTVDYYRHNIQGKLIGVATQKVHESLEFPTPKTVVANCRLSPEEAISALGEIGLWCSITTSVNPIEIGTVFMLGVGHMPLQTKTRRQASLYRFIIQF
jgi:hypothetical protein